MVSTILLLIGIGGILSPSEMVDLGLQPVGHTDALRCCCSGVVCIGQWRATGACRLFFSMMALPRRDNVPHLWKTRRREIFD